MVPTHPVLWALVLATGVGCSAPSIGSRCPGLQLCDGVCCRGTQTCTTDVASGTSFCAQTCTSSSQCPVDTPCCTPLVGSCQAGADCPSSCVTAAANRVCRCTQASECATGCCAPALDQNGQLVGFSICHADDGRPFDCCNSVACLASYNCCVTDAQGNNFCAPPCTSDADCLAGHCDAPGFAMSNCAGPYACGN